MTTTTKTAEIIALEARVAELTAIVERKEVNDGSIVKLSTKGSLSMYGLGHYPVTLTYTQWLKVIKQIPALTAFAITNKAKLFFKSDEQREAAFPTAK